MFIPRKIIAFLLAIFFILTLVICCYNFSGENNPAIEFRKHNNTYALSLPNHLQFAGEDLDFSDAEIAERFDREMHINVYWQSQTIITLKKCARWFPVIEPILKAQGVPDDFKYLAVAESNFSNVVSPSGAAGFWQFMPDAARQNKLIVNEEIDERYHVEKATVAACNYLKESKLKFGSWLLAAASYNMGVEGVQTALQTQQVKRYQDLLLNEETSRYVFRIAALKSVIVNSEAFGFHLKKSDYYTPYEYDILTTDSNITNLAEFALSKKINYKTLKLLNPWLRKNTLTLIGKIPVPLKILKKDYRSFKMYDDKILNKDSI